MWERELLFFLLYWDISSWSIAGWVSVPAKVRFNLGHSCYVLEQWTYPFLPSGFKRDMHRGNSSVCSSSFFVCLFVFWFSLTPQWRIWLEWLDEIISCIFKLVWPIFWDARLQLSETAEIHHKTSKTKELTISFYKYNYFYFLKKSSRYLQFLLCTLKHNNQ